MVDDSTVAALMAMKQNTSWATLANRWGFNSGTLWMIANRKNVSRETENRLRTAIGLQPLPSTRTVTVNPPTRWRDMPVRDVAAAIRCRYEYPTP